MNPTSYEGNAKKDAVFLSPHKLVGGVSTPGILLLKKRLLKRGASSATPGGGTVFYVTEKDHIYAKYILFTKFNI
jgi:selenocysteine lyase/cysteine desulfurase